jgi:hypothetical protein
MRVNFVLHRPLLKKVSYTASWLSRVSSYLTSYIYICCILLIKTQLYNLVDTTISWILPWRDNSETEPYKITSVETIAYH